jgi:hypothetical protein
MDLFALTSQTSILKRVFFYLFAYKKPILNVYLLFLLEKCSADYVFLTGKLLTRSLGKASN